MIPPSAMLVRWVTCAPCAAACAACAGRGGRIYERDDAPHQPHHDDCACTYESADKPGAVRVLVAGLPGSGNTVCREHLARCGFSAHVDHARNDTSKQWRNWSRWANLIVVPFRLDEEARRASAARRGGGFSLDPGFPDEARARIAAAGKPVAILCFEELLRTGGWTLDQIIRQYLGVEPAPWPDTVDRSTPETGAIMSEATRRDVRSTLLARGR